MNAWQAIERLRSLFRSRRLDRELDGEIAAHLELAERDGIARGLSPAEARRQARVLFGGLEPMREDHRDRRSVRWLETFAIDFRYGLASLFRDRGFAAVAIGVLALGIGANAAMFSVMDAVLFKPLPFPDPDQIVRLWEAPVPTERNQTSSADFLEWKRRSTSFSVLAAQASQVATLMLDGEATQLSGELVSADYFDVFGIQPLIGRAFAPGDDQPGAPKVIVLSHATWTSVFGADPAVLSRDLSLDGETHRVVGVLPPKAFDRDGGRQADQPAAFWKPLVFDSVEVTGGAHWLNAVARLRKGVSREQAQAEMDAIRVAMSPQMSAAKKVWTFAVDPVDDRLISDDLRRSIYVAMGAVVLVLFIACANIANLLFARGASRRQEMSVRAALGAGRRRLVAQLLTESLVLCLLGGAFGLAVGAALISVAVPLLPLAVPFTSPISLDARVLAFSTALTAITAMAVAVLPALQASSAPLAQALTQGARGSSVARERLRRLLVSAEVALSVVLVCGALLLFKSLLNLQRVPLGVESDRVISTSLDLPPAFFPTATHATTLYDNLVTRVNALPGIVRVSMASHVPLEGAGGETLRVPGRDERVLVRFKRVDPDYFSTLTLRVVAGRAFNTSDSLGAAPVAIINEHLAQRIAAQFGIRNPVGSTVSLPALGYSGSVTRVNMMVVGVVGTERIRTDLRVPMDDAVAYVPLAQAPKRAVTLLVRTSGEPAAMASAIREAIRRTDNRVVAANMRTMAQIKRRSLSGASEPAFVVGVFATVAVLLAALGLYGVLAHVVAQQRREIGIRMALGATARNVVGRVVTHALWMIAGGLALGLVASALLTRVTSSLLFEVSALDPAVFIGAGAAMLAVGVFASLIPAVRAARVDPTTALRAEG